MLNKSIHIQIIQNRGVFFHFDTIKIFVLITAGKLSGKFSGKLPTGIFNQLFDAIFDAENYFSWQICVGQLVRSFVK